MKKISLVIILMALCFATSCKENKKESEVEITEEEMAPAPAEETRITSYNVCYTKLLRLLYSNCYVILSEKHPDSSGMAYKTIDKKNRDV